MSRPRNLRSDITIFSALGFMGMACAKLLIAPRPLSWLGSDMLHGSIGWSSYVICMCLSHSMTLHFKFEMRTVQASSSWIFISNFLLSWYLSYFGYSFIFQPILMQWLNPETEAAWAIGREKWAGSTRRSLSELSGSFKDQRKQGFAKKRALGGMEKCP